MEGAVDPQALAIRLINVEVLDVITGRLDPVLA
jgi:hypothetical protein